MAGPVNVRPANVREIMDCLHMASSYAAPFRPMGAASSSTDCNHSSGGTIIDMTAFDQVLEIDLDNYTVTVQAGIRLGVLAEALAQEGLELAGSYDLLDRTVGGAIAGVCMGPSIADDGAFFASQLVALKIVTPEGSKAKISADNKTLLRAFRLSYGMLGVIYEATLRVRPILTFVATHRRCTIKQFAAATESLSRVDVGVKFYLMPFRDRVYLDLRRYSPEMMAGRKLPWKIKDWGESTVLPNIFKSISRIVPASTIRYRIIDEISKATQGMVNNRLVNCGSHSSTLSGAPRRDRSVPLQYSTWAFPAADFAIVVQTYTDFCLRIQKENGFRCDMPTVGFRLPKDQSAILSPTFDEPMFALRAVCTQTRGWEDFVLDFADFAEHWGGSPLFNQTRGVSAEHSRTVLGNRASAFTAIRRQLDPGNRLINPFLSQFFL